MEAILWVVIAVLVLIIVLLVAGIYVVASKVVDTIEEMAGRR